MVERKLFMSNLKKEMIEKAQKLNEMIKGREFHIEVKECFKNNGMKVAYVLVSENRIASPTIYMKNIEDIWDDDEKLIKYFDEIFEYSKNVNVNIKEICSRENILESVKPKLISENNLEDVINNDVVYVRYLDMLILFYVEIPDFADDGIASYSIKEKILNNTGISKEELYENALKNSENDYIIRNMESVICEMMGIPETDETMNEAFKSSIPMYVFTNKEAVNGASVLLNKKALAEISEIMKGDFIVLPSSTHECIAIPAEYSDKESLREMVREVNDGEVSLEDRLTYSVYKYSKGELSIL